MALQHNLVVFQMCRPIWNKFIELAVLSDAIEVPQDPTFSLVKWIPQGFSWVDPLKEQKAQMEAVRSGFKSRAEVVSELGYDVEEIDDEISEDNKRADNLNLQFDSDSRTIKGQKEKNSDSKINE